MNDMTVQTAVGATAPATVAADCESVAKNGAVPTQDTLSSNLNADGSWLTDGEPSAEESKTDDGSEATCTFKPIYKGKTYPMAASDNETITTLLQLGMKQRDMQPLMEDLQRLAMQNGAKSIKDYVAQMQEENEARALQEAVDTYGEQAGRAYFEAQQERWRQQKVVPVDEQLLLSERLAAEFYELRKEFADYTSIGQLPKEVIDTAMTESISLTDALLRYRHRQDKLTQTEKRAAVKSAVSSVGSLSHMNDSRSSSAMDAFLRGLHRRL